MNSTIPHFYHCTPNLRWRIADRDYLADLMQPVFAKTPLTLQQLWVCDHTGDMQWRDVEVVTEPTPDAPLAQSG